MFSFVLYWRDKRINELSSILRTTLAVLRFITVSLIAFLLLETLLESTENKTEKPILVIAQDNSESILFSEDSIELSNNFTSKIRSLNSELKDKFDVKYYTFGNSISEKKMLDYSEKETNIASVLEEISTRYYNRNIGAIVLSSDGIYNKGSNPLFFAKKLKNTPIYSIALGDTIEKKDIYIDNILNNRLVYTGNKFPVEIEIKAEQCNNKKSVVKITKNGTVLKTREIFFKDKKSIQTISFELEAKGVGIQKYSVSVSPISDEFSVTNNYNDFYVEVLNSKQKVLIIANSPHPDISAIKNAIESNENYETKVVIGDFNGEINKYNLLVVHNLPSINKDIKSIILKSKKNKIPILFTIGNQTDIPKFNMLNTGLKIKKAKNVTLANGYINNNFNLFKINNNLNNIVSNFEPIQVPFSQDFELSNSSEVMIYQKIGPSKTKYPLIGFNKLETSKYGFIVGEGIWKWKLQDYSLNKTNSNFNSIITQSIQYLVSKEDKSFFRVTGDKNYFENKNINFNAEVYNKSYELDNTPEVKMAVSNAKDEKFNYVFTRTKDSYNLNIGSLPSGNYKYKSNTTINGTNYSKSGEFVINKLQIEKNNPVANHQLLFNISDVSGGKLYYKNQIDLLSQELLNKKDIVNIIYQQKDAKDIINLKLIFFSLLLLLSFEWFFRKRNGAY